MEREENDKWQRRRRETPEAAESMSRHRLDDNITRRSRSRTRCYVNAASRRSRSRSPVRGNGTPRRSRSRSRHDVVHKDGETSHHTRHRSRAPLRGSEVSAHESFLSRERELQRKEERLNKMMRMLEEEIARERSALARSNSQRQLHEPDAVPTEAIGKGGSSGGRNERVCSNDDDGDEPTMLRPRNSESVTLTTKDVTHLINALRDDKNRSSTPTKVETPSQSGTNFNNRNILPSFDPSSRNQRITVWLKKVKECAFVYGWDEKTTIHFAMQKLEGLAKTWYESLNSILFSWPEWQEKLLKAFPCEQNYGQSLEEMLKRKSRFNEAIEVYYYEKLALLNQCDIDGKRAVDCIIHGLSDKTMKSSALALRCQHPDQLLHFLMSNKDSGFNADRLFHRNVNTRPRYEQMSGPGNSDNRNSRASTSHINNAIFCYNCKEKGHPYMKCSKPIIICSTCKRFGHKTESCRVKSEDNKVTTRDTVQKTLCIGVSKSNSKFNKKVLVNDISFSAFIDFGSTASLMSKSTMTSLGLECDNMTTPLKGFGNDIVPSLGGVKAKLEVDGVQAVVDFQVVDDKFLEVPILIGQTFTEQTHVMVFKNAQELKFYDVGREMPFADADIWDDSTVKVKVVVYTRVYGTASVKVVTEPPIDGNIIVNGKILGKPPHQYTICGGIYRVNKGVTYIGISPTIVQAELIGGTTLCRGTRVHIVNRIVNAKEEPFILEHSDIDEDKVSIGENVGPHYKQKLLDILNKYKHCFATKLQELGCTSVTEMSIDINSKQPVVYRPYRLSHKEREQVRGMVSEMLEAGIIRESVSEYASPIILVRKKDGKLRMCIDYRLLNSITVKERYPMPIIEDEIARLSGQAFFVTLDLASGYYQVPISETSKALTSFVTPDGQYEFNRMPFGLANAPAVFQRMMNKVLGSARYTEATAYIDDVLIYGKDEDECLGRLEKILKLLEDANLTLNLSKCEFLRDKVDYLGYEISAAGIRPGDRKIKCVVDFPKPSNQHTTRQFLGLVGYFRKFIRNFAHIANPLTKLLKKDATWLWEEEQERAFEVLKSMLTDRPILAIYDYNAEHELHTDASKLGIGGILMQRSTTGKEVRPVAFYSRQTTPEEKHFHAYELETLAVVCSLKKFRVYLLGKDFKVITDCSALRSTFSKRDIIPRVARWWLLLQEFQCSIDYRAGTKMSHVDALSRNPIQDCEAEDVHDQYPTVMTISNDDWLQTLQLGDTELCRIRDIITSDISERDLKHIKENYVLKDNKLYKCNNGDKNDLRWVVPKGARWQICRINHDEIGHFGVEKTQERIKKAYWFQGMSKFIKKYVQACVQCAFSKKSQRTKEGLLHTIDKIEDPFHTVHIDHLGPFVRSKRGNTHLLVIVEAFTKFVFLKPVRNTSTQCVLRALEDVFCTFRYPDRLISDRGSCFTSHNFKRFCLEKGIKHVLNAVVSPRSNGQVERYNRTVLDSLTAQNLNCDERIWDEKVGIIQWGLNNTTQKTTGRSPSEVLFGSSMSAEFNPTLNEVREHTRQDKDVTLIREEVKERIKESQIKQKENYDKGRKPARIYNEGDLVKISKTQFNNEGKSTKLLPVYAGPYKVISALGNDRYKLAAIPGLTGTKHKRKTIVAADRILPWIHITALNVQNTDSNDEDSDESN